MSVLKKKKFIVFFLCKMAEKVRRSVENFQSPLQSQCNNYSLATINIYITPHGAHIPSIDTCWHISLCFLLISYLFLLAWLAKGA